MARTASIAVAGYFPTPNRLVPRIAALIDAKRDSFKENEFAFLDPCAGDGEAVMLLAKSLFDSENLLARVATIYAAEMEETRFSTIEVMRRTHSMPYGVFEAKLGDAFRMTWKLGDRYGRPCRGINILFLNPPYDMDPVHGRLEERFLERFTGVLAEGGALALLVPYYALKASAKTLAKHYTNLHCFRFPGDEFAAFKQVVLVAEKRTLLAPDAATVAQVEAWAGDASQIPDLPENPTPVVSALSMQAGFVEWDIAAVDLQGILKRGRAWHSTDRGGRLNPIQGIAPSGNVLDLLTREYPVAMPPRPAHIAAGIAAGVFNGAMIRPDSDLSGLPPILVKGAFDREFVTVDEKANKDGEKTGEVQIQQPRLTVTVLDLKNHSYHTVISSANITGAKTVSSMTTGDLLSSYGRGLMRVMLDHCPVLHSPSVPEDQIALPELPRKLYQAQAQAVMASVKLLGGVCASKAKRRGKAAFVLGEIGSGKSTVALATAQTIGSKRALIMCPPHLLDGWRDQTMAVLPWAKIVTLTSVADVDALAEDRTEGMVVAIMSREAAKLGHAWESVGPTCPKCGATVPRGDLAKSRACCPAKSLRAADDHAKLAQELALRLMSALAKSATVAQVLRGRHLERVLQAHVDNPAKWTKVRPCIQQTVKRLVTADMRHDELEAVTTLLHALGDDAFTAEVACRLYEASLDDREEYGPGSTARDQARQLLFLCEPQGPEQNAAVERLMAHGEIDTPRSTFYGRMSRWATWQEAAAKFASGTNPYLYGVSREADGVLVRNKARKGSSTATLAGLSMLVKLGTWEESEECGEPLYQALPQPRRVPLATYLTKRFPALIDLLVLDEGHEYSGDGSAQGFAAHRLTALGIPTLMMTGSVMNGYAESLFANQWALDPEFRKEFSRDQRQEFVRRYGYLKQLVEDKDKDTGKTVEFGSMTDRVEKSIRTIGNAPGVLPLFVLRYLLRLAVTLHKSDLALDLPPRVDIVEKIAPNAEQKKRLDALQSALMEQIRKDQFGEKAGKLWGQMAELPSYLDRATLDVGNGQGDHYVVRYPESEGGDVVATAELFDTATLLPKEEWMLAKIKSELEEGRRAMVFTWHTALMPRIARLIEEHLGEKCPVLDANKVAAGKRQAWIDKEVVKKGRRVMVVNPVAIQTGLNNLVWFSTELWMENPAVNAIVFRQATGRVDRIGQVQETRIIFPIYEGTTQEALHKLLLHKVGVSMSTDGLDAESALQAAGVGETQAMSAFAVGRQLYEMILSAAA